ncbi:MAG TPA: quinone-dependent dihydroorotate dehydrogenase [Candidatus Angelobacter sp.]|nr:quinone-dependent dihydroorotate dehydrogenase [Candidatus Angelobacter sp.]
MIRRNIWKINRFSYKYIAKPVLFLMTPDYTHSSMITVGSAIGKVAFVRLLMKLASKRPRDTRLIQKYHGVEFDSPVGLSAGLDKNGEIIPMIANLGFGFTEVGSVTAKQCKGNPRPWFYRLPKTQSLVVYAGLGNQGSATIIKRIHQYPQKAIHNFPIILSVAKTNSCEVVDIKTGIADYVTTVKRAKNEPRIKMIELNISCPNTFGGEPFTTPSRLERLLKAVDTVGTRQPIYIKMPVDLPWDAFRALLDVIVRHRVVGVTIANLAKDRTKVELKDVLPDSVQGNLSGKPTWKLCNELIRQTYLAYGDKLTIIGVGGIFTAEDAYTKIRLGASLIEVITGVIYGGPQIAIEINDGLVSLLERDGYTNISQAIGVDTLKK